MQIELIGCTSAGKSSLAREILRAARDAGEDVVLGEDLVLGTLGLRPETPWRALALNLAGVAMAVRSWRSHRAFLGWVLGVLRRLPLPPLARAHTLRNVLKRIGIYELIRRHSEPHEIVLVDEGVLQVAHYLLVHLSARVDPGLLPEFCRLAPRPDVAVYLRPPTPVLVARTLARGHKRIPDPTPERVSEFIGQAVQTFDALAQHLAADGRLVTIAGLEPPTIAAGHSDDPQVARALSILAHGAQVVAPSAAVPQAGASAPHSPGRSLEAESGLHGSITP
jgi:hypothetical protein